MKHKLTVGLIGLGLALLVPPQLALASSSDLQQAIKETQKAIHYGHDPHHASSFVQHGENAIHDGLRAEKAQPNRHIKSGVSHLRRGVRIAKGTHSRTRLLAGAKQARAALRQFEAVK